MQLLLLLARKAGFGRLSARDVALAESLNNTEFLWQLFVKARVMQLLVLLRCRAAALHGCKPLQHSVTGAAT